MSSDATARGTPLISTAAWMALGTSLGMALVVPAAHAQGAAGLAGASTVSTDPGAKSRCPKSNPGCDNFFLKVRAEPESQL